MECPVCLEVYQTPLLLPGCGHTICTPCAHSLVTSDNYLSCPECRLLYQLRRGVASLPKNIALARTIAEAEEGKSTPRCDDHPGSTASLYCRTCCKHICLDCYFCTLGRGAGKGNGKVEGDAKNDEKVERKEQVNGEKATENKTNHYGHDVRTSDAVLAKEKRLLQEGCKSVSERIAETNSYITNLRESEQKMKEALDGKLATVEKQKEQLISAIKQTASKLKYVLKGTVVRDSESIQAAIKAADERLALMKKLHTESQRVLKNSGHVPVQSLMEIRQKLGQCSSVQDNNNVPSLLEPFRAVEQFDTDIEACLNDPTTALACQSDYPRAPSIVLDECIVSDTAACIALQYNPRVRTRQLRLQYKQNGGGDDNDGGKECWDCEETDELRAGTANVRLRHLHPGTLYTIKAMAVNSNGSSEDSNEVLFRTADSKPEIQSS